MRRLKTGKWKDRKVKKEKKERKVLARCVSTLLASVLVPGHIWAKLAYFKEIIRILLASEWPKQDLEVEG